MITEHPSPRFENIDIWEPAEILDAMIGGQLCAVAAVRAALPALQQAGHALEVRLRSGGRLVYAGAGTSGRLAVQDGAELMPTFGWPRDRLLLLLAGGDEAMTRAIEGAEDEGAEAIDLVRRHDIRNTDALVAVAASGTTPFTVAALHAAKERGALTIGIANNAATPLLATAEIPILLETGAEPIAGSTRMNAGTAQRVALSMLSTLVMIRLGRVYRGVMIDVQASNRKLERRKLEMLCHLTGAEADAAAEALAQAEGSIRRAVLLLLGCSRAAADSALAETGGNLRQAVDLVRSARDRR